MPSQEEYLDKLLQNLAENHENVESQFTDEMSRDYEPVAEEPAADEIDAMLQSLIEEHETGEAEAEDAFSMDGPEETEDVYSMDEPEETEDVYSMDKPEEADITDEDILADLLNGSDDADLREIQSLLQKADNNEMIEEPQEEILEEFQDEIAEEEQNEIFEEPQNEIFEEPQDEIAEEMQKSPEETNPVELEEDLLRDLEAFDFLADIPEKDSMSDISESAGEDSLAQIMEQEAAKKSKKGLFARILDFINEEDDEPENEDIRLSDENETIIKEMDTEKKKGKKARKAKKGKKDAGFGETSDENGEEIAENAVASNGRKAKKAKKPNKEKQPKEVGAESADAGKKIPLKQILMVALVCLSIGTAIVVFVQIVGEYSDKQAGRKAFYEEDYQTCYQNLFGKDLNESEQVMYSKSESILMIRMWIREYELLAGEGQEAKALDSLLQSVYQYPKLYTHAATWNADAEVEEAYNRILNILSEKYHLTEEQAKEITNNPDDIEYTKMVMAIARGEKFDSLNQADAAEDATDVLQDLLPEEEEIKDSHFVDNHK